MHSRIKFVERERKNFFSLPSSFCFLSFSSLFLPLSVFSLSLLSPRFLLREKSSPSFDQIPWSVLLLFSLSLVLLSFPLYCFSSSLLFLLFEFFLFSFLLFCLRYTNSPKVSPLLFSLSLFLFFACNSSDFFWWERSTEVRKKEKGRIREREREREIWFSFPSCNHPDNHSLFCSLGYLFDTHHVSLPLFLSLLFLSLYFFLFYLFLSLFRSLFSLSPFSPLLLIAKFFHSYSFSFRLIENDNVCEWVKGWESITKIGREREWERKREQSKRERERIDWERGRRTREHQHLEPANFHSTHQPLPSLFLTLFLSHFLSLLLIPNFPPLSTSVQEL